MAFAGQSVHIPSAFSVVEIIRTLHDKHLRYPENDPNHPDRDFFILSKGHGVMALYPILEERGWIPSSFLDQYFSSGSSLPGLYEAHIPGCEANTGSLGQGISVAVGVAKSARIRRTTQRVFCLTGDGEINEGAFWEAVMFASHHALDNFNLIIDLNGFQAMGSTKEILSLSGLSGILNGFGYNVVIVDGHDERELSEAIDGKTSMTRGRPLAILARTIKGKGVSFMENDNSWHYRRLDHDTFEEALREIELIT